MKKIFLIIIAALSISACNSVHSDSNLESKDNSYQGYQIINESSNKIDAQTIETFENYLNRHLKKFGYQNGEGIKISYKIEAYDEGNRALRYFIGFGAGAAEAIIRVEVSDLSGKKLGEINTDSTTRMGFFGGSSDKSLNATAAHIAKRIYRAKLLKPYR